MWDKPGSEGQYIYPKMAYLTFYEPLGWYIGSSFYIEDIDNKISLIMMPIIFFMILFFVFSLLLSLWISVGISKPLSTLIESISQTDDTGLPLFTLPVLGFDEIRVLSQTIESLVKTINASRFDLKKQRDFSMNIIEGGT